MIIIILLLIIIIILLLIKYNYNIIIDNIKNDNIISENCHVTLKLKGS